MAECPPGYCCSGTSTAPCSAVDSCAPTRTGALCSDCAPGFVEGLGSATCTPVADCSRDMALVWPVLVGAVFASAVVQLTIVSGVWRAQGRATGKMKSFIFFLQMASFAVVAGLRPSRAVSILLAVLHGGSFGGANTAASTAGFCVSHSLTSRFKVMLEAGLQLSVGVAMVLLVAAGAACRVRRETKGRRPSIQVSVALRELAYGAEPLLPASLQLTTDPDHGAASSSARVYGREVEDRSMHTRLVTAAVNFALTAYGTVTLALMRLLHCVHVPGSPGGQQRLYIAGSVVCEYGGWQLPLVVVLIVMC